MIVRIILAASYFSRLLPLRFLLVGGDILGLIWFYLIPIRRGVVISNIRFAYRESLSDTEIWALARRNYRHYGRILVEILRSVSWSRSDYLLEVTYHGLDQLIALKESGRAAYVLSLHVGNWEVAIGATAASGIPFCVVVKQGNSTLYRKMQEWYRSRQDVMVLAESHTANEILKCISSGRTVGFVLDQFMGPPIGLPVTFFGREAGTAAALALLTERRKADVVLTYTHRALDGRLHVTFETLRTPPGDRPDLAGRLFEKTQFYNDQLERVVRRYPDQWMWLHKRWKDYRGEPRWRRLTQAAAVSGITMAVICLLSCTTQPPITSPTGIALPDDKPIEAPLFAKEDPKAIMVAPPPTVMPTPTPMGKVHHKPEVSKKVEMAAMPIENVLSFAVIPKDRIPFDVGERLEIDLTWMALPAGTAILEVRNGVMFDTRPTFWLWGNVLSSRLVDAIYHLDNTAESYVDSEGMIPYKFLLHMFETNQKKETRVLFNHPKAAAFYWSKRISQRWGDETNDRTDTLTPQARDMFSALYYSRLLDYHLGETQRFPVYENGQNWEVEVNPVANELVKSPAGVFQCWKLMISIKLRNVLSQAGDVAMWLSDDSKRYLVKFDAKIKIGSLLGILSKIREKT